MIYVDLPIESGDLTIVILVYQPLPLRMVFLTSLLLLLNEHPPFTGHDSCSARTLKHALWILLDPFGVTSAHSAQI